MWPICRVMFFRDGINFQTQEFFKFLEEVAAAEAGITQTIAPRPSKTTIGQQLGWNGKENP